MSLGLIDASFAAVSFSKVSFVYDVGTPFERKALDNVSFSIGQGSFFGIAGSSGSGKTTVAKILKGLAKPSSGSVALKDFGKVGLAFQYPEFQLFESTVLRDAMFGPLNMGLGEETARSFAEDALKAVGLDSSFYGRDPLALSGGEKRCAAIAGVLSMNPDILVLDEPAAGLDPEMHDRLFSLLVDLNGEGKTIVLVSHSMDDIAQYCDRMVYMREGLVVADGTPAQVFSSSNTLDAVPLDLGIPLPSMVSLANDLRSCGFALPPNVCTLDGLEKSIVELLG